MKRSLVSCLCLLIPLTGLFLSELPTSAGPDLPTITNSTAVFVGNQSNGVIVEGSAGAQITTIWVTNLSGQITPASGTPGVKLNKTGAGNAVIIVGTQDMPEKILTSQAPAISAASTGSPVGEPYRDPFLGIPVPTNAASAGGVVQVENHSDISTAGNKAHGIVAQSQTTGFSEAVLTELRSYTGANVSWQITIVTNSDDTTTLPGSWATGTAVAADGASLTNAGGGKFLIASDGAVQFDPGTNFNYLTEGQTAQSVVHFIAQGISSTGTNNTWGTMIAEVTRTAEGLACTNGAYFAEYGPSTKLDSAIPDLRAYAQAQAESAAAGGDANSVEIQHAGTLRTAGEGAFGIYAKSIAGNGGKGSGGSISHSAGKGGPGSMGGDAKISASGLIMTSGDNAAGIAAVSHGGYGGTGGDGGFWRYGGPGGDGGTGGSVFMNGDATIYTSGTNAPGVFGLSQGGDGGPGGNSDKVFTGGGQGGAGGQGGLVELDGSWNVFTSGSNSHGIWGRSSGGNAGTGGSGGWLAGHPGGGGIATDGGTVRITSGGAISASGTDAYGILGQSIGGFGGTGGTDNAIFYGHGGNGNSAGSGGRVEIQQASSGSISNTGVRGHGILAQSIGGGGGTGGGGAALVGEGGSGSPGGHGGQVIVSNDGAIRAMGDEARGIYAQSIGGSGGDGGDAKGAGAIGGTGSGTSDGGTVTVTNRGKITSMGNAVFAESVGGGGGSGGSSSGWFAVGGSGAGGGNAGEVLVVNSGDLVTSNFNASGIFAQSVGGGGGHGGGSVAAGPVVAVAIGGNAGIGGNGSAVKVIADGGHILTTGTNAHGIIAQSVGGGGGSGGYAVAAAASPDAGFSLGIGGKGGGGGLGDMVEVFSHADIDTFGENAHGIFAQSLGGGGGSGGFSIAATISAGNGGALAIGGKGGPGNSASNVVAGTISNPLSGTIRTSGNHSYGVAAQSVGGGGGDGGFAISATMSLGSAAAFSFGGSGAGGGKAGNVSLVSDNTIFTEGDDSHGLFAQSLGGGGGSGGFSIAAVASAGWALGVSIGGGGGDGNTAGDVFLRAGGPGITTSGARSHGIMAESVGGGGGAGGFSVAGSISGGPGINFGMGGGGGAGSSAGNVEVQNSSIVRTYGDESHGIFAQSVGGGGGNGGFSVAGSVTISAPSLTASVGGKGGEGSDGGKVNVLNQGVINTAGAGSYGIFAQSVGGGGGSGGFSVAGSMAKEGSQSLKVSIGGSGGTGGHGSTVSVSNQGSITNTGVRAFGILAQSVGGGGGVGGSATTYTWTAGQAPENSVSINVNFALGGNGSTGGLGGWVFATNSGSIVTSGEGAHGLLAQSVGGGGGAGGSATASRSSLKAESSRSVEVNAVIGGDGGSAGNGTNVFVVNSGFIATAGDNAYGILAQSVGGGGGAGGDSKIEHVEPLELISDLVFAPAPAAATNKEESASWSVNLNVGFGGEAGGGGNAGKVDVINSGDILTLGRNSAGIFAQSVGGGGGIGGSSGTDVGGSDANVGVTLNLNVGAKGGAGGSSDLVTVHSSGSVRTYGDLSHGIVAQSVGGGGGVGGGSFSSIEKGGDENKISVNLELGLGGAGGSAGDAGSVTVLNSGNIATAGNAASGVLAQSIGGGGGFGGVSITGGGDATTPWAFGLSVGGNGGAGGDGKSVTVTNTGAITTAGIEAHGVMAQSIGGGGGAGVYAAHGTNENSRLLNLAVTVGGAAGTAGDASLVVVRQAGSIQTAGDGSFGVLAQSIGGGGGVGGKGAGGVVHIGGSGGAGGAGGDVVVDLTGNITTSGHAAHGIFAQSVGGGGGIAGAAGGGLSTDEGVFDSIGLGLGIGQSGGSGGNAGNVRVNSAGNIVTAGNASCGIFAQSVGGGGGLAGSTGLFGFAGSAGAAGSGGEVVVEHTGNIVTLGTNSHGIFVQSVGGEDNGGKVRVNVVGSIVVNGENSDAVVVQSAGGRTNEDMFLTLNEGSVRGGKGAGAGLRLFDGLNNVLTNYAQLSSASGRAILGGAGNDTIYNFKAVTGTVDLGGGLNRFVIMPGAVFDAGANARLNADGVLVNNGTLRPGGIESLQRTFVTGRYEQGPNAVLGVQLSTPWDSDALTVQGSAHLDGTLDATMWDTAPPTKGDRFEILTASDGVTGEFTSVADPIRGLYALKLGTLYSSGSMSLITLQDSFRQFAKTANQISVARNLDTCSGLNTTGGDPRSGELVEYLNTVPGSRLPERFDAIAPEEHGALIEAMKGAGALQTDHRQQRLRELRAGLAGPGRLALYDAGGRSDRLWNAGDHNWRPSPDAWNVYAIGQGRIVDVESTMQADGFDIKTAGVTLGADRRANDNFAYGISAGYVGDDAGLSSGGDVDVNGAIASLYGTYFGPSAFIEGAIGGGLHYYDVRRQTIGGASQASTDGGQVDVMLGAGYGMRKGGLWLGPVAALRYQHTQVNEFVESGSMVPLRVEDIKNDSLITELGASLVWDVRLGDMKLRPEVRLTWNHECLDENVAIDSRFASGAGGAFRVHSPDIGRDSLGLTAGLSNEWTDDFSTSLFYGGDLARENYSAHSMWLALIWNF